MPEKNETCTYANQCPFYSGKKLLNNTPTFEIKERLCKKGLAGWKKCSRYKLQINGIPVPQIIY